MISLVQSAGLNQSLESKENTGDTFDIPAGITFTEFVFLSIVIR